MMKFAGFSLIMVLLIAGCTQNGPSVKADNPSPSAAASAPATTSSGIVIEQNPGPGPYVGTALGYPEYEGTITVTLEVADGILTSVTVHGPLETVGIGSEAVDFLGIDMYERNTIKVDKISGATFTSEGILLAAERALAKAGLTNDNLRQIPPRESPDRSKLEIDPSYALDPLFN